MYLASQVADEGVQAVSWAILLLRWATPVLGLFEEIRLTTLTGHGLLKAPGTDTCQGRHPSNPYSPLTGIALSALHSLLHPDSLGLSVIPDFRRDSAHQNSPCFHYAPWPQCPRRVHASLSSPLEQEGHQVGSRQRGAPLKRRHKCIAEPGR